MRLLPFVALPALPESIEFRWYLAPVAGRSLLAVTISELALLFPDEQICVLSRSAGEVGRLARLLVPESSKIHICTGQFLYASMAARMEENDGNSGYQGVLLATPLMPLVPRRSVNRVLETYSGRGGDLVTVSDAADLAAPKVLSRELVSFVARSHSEESLAGPIEPMTLSPAQSTGLSGLAADFDRHYGRSLAVSIVGDSAHLAETPFFPPLSYPEDIESLELAVHSAGGSLPPNASDLVNRWREIRASDAHSKLTRASKRLAGLTSARRSRSKREPRRILYVAVESAFSGAEASFALLATRVHQTRYSPLALVGADGTLANKLRVGGVSSIVPGRAYWEPSTISLSYFVDLLAEHEIELVHVNSWRARSVVLAARLLGIPVISHLRAFPESHYVPALADCDAVICVSESVERELQRYPLDQRRVFRVYNGVDMSEFPLRSFAASRGKRTVLMVANIGPAKGQDLLIRTIPLVCESFPAAEFVFVGEVVYPAYYGYLRQLCRDLRCEEQAKFIGFQDPMYPLYQEADALVLCSVREPFSRAILEAQAAGVPVIAAGSGGTPEIIVHGENGILFRERKPEVLAESIKQLLGDQLLACRLATDGHRVVSSRFTIQRHVESVMGIYDSVLTNTHSFTPS